MNDFASSDLPRNNAANMRADFTAIIESAEEGGYWVICPEVPGANGQGKTVEEAKRNMAQAINLLKEDEKIESGRARNL